MALLVFSALALISFVPISSQKCFSSSDCLPEMPFFGATISMRCDIACAKCLSKSSGICTRSDTKDSCSYKCICVGTPVSSIVRQIDKKYCEFAKNHMTVMSATIDV
ncbi:hypothetical protein Q1695_015832 [Nippostrongylus brasiliensis]|nr:hypothetical protein Q1695_015832 [Nippostrongylus brasiliensis]